LVTSTRSVVDAGFAVEVVLLLEEPELHAASTTAAVASRTNVPADRARGAVGRDNARIRAPYAPGSTPEVERRRHDGTPAVPGRRPGVRATIRPTGPGIGAWARRKGSNMARRSSLRSELYRAARDLGDAQSAAKGPGAYAKRVARRRVYRQTDTLTNNLVRSAGLMGTRRR
jgi:hypothetical protein